ncbi:ABC transporter permease [Bosea sp. LjRoot237]|uniref:ABC transporter permease n=1 Tax=Bosea sp. LjRoot237 TaxID=3342292 RepID=UPI003ECF9DCB
MSTTGQSSFLSRRDGLLEALLANRIALLSALLLLAIALSAVAAGTITGDDPFLIRPRLRLRPPGGEFWFGTDALGRDVFALVLHGGRISLLVGLLAALAGAAIGTVVGLLTGYLRWLDPVVMRIMDGIMAIPGILFAVALVSLVGPSIVTIVAAITFSEIPRVTRLVRSVVLSVREESYVRAAEGLGIPPMLVLLRHILPSCIAPLIVQTTYMFAAAILSEAVLGFLGVGFPPDVPSWGNVLAEGRAVFQRAPWTIIAPGLFLAVTVMAVNLLGDGLRDRLDPRLSRAAKVSS